MRKKNQLVKLYDEFFANFNTGMIAWLLHRITGVLLVLYFFMHAFVIGSAVRGGVSFDAALAKVQTPFFHILEIGLIGVIFFHLLNGLRLLIIDLTGLSKAHKVLFWFFTIALLVFMGYTATMILTDVLSATGGHIK
ncbi:MAG: succinate dehydrogenase, cytochrome b556 subunit [bacterium]